LVEAAIGNELGHWEPAEVVAMNDRALLSAKGDVNSVFPVSQGWLRSQSAREFVTEVESFIARLGDAPQTWFIKDPRISLLAGLWSEGVQRAGASPRFVIAFRNPWEVAASLTKRQLHHFPDEVWPVERGLALWLNYMLAIERKTRGLPRSFVNYEDFLSDWSGELARVHRQLGLAPPEIGEDAKREIEAFVRPDERHARHEAMQTRGGLASQVYGMFLERVSDPNGGKTALDKAGRTFTASFDVLGGYIGALEARTSQFGPLKAEVSRAETEALTNRQAVQSLERRMMHLARMGTASAAPGEAGAPRANPSPDDSLLRQKYDALKAAHRQNVLALQAERLSHDEVLAHMSRAFEQELQSKDDRLAELKQEAARRLEQLAALEAERVSVPERLERAHHLAADAERALEGKGVDLLALEQALQHSRQEVLDAREAYEALRLESAALRVNGKMAANADQAVREAIEANGCDITAIWRQGAVSNELQDSREAYEGLRSEVAELYMRLRATDALLIEARQAIATAEAAQAELALIRRSRSWRITSPLRSAASMLGRH
jgi:hypothetical protein